MLISVLGFRFVALHLGICISTLKETLLILSDFDYMKYGIKIPDEAVFVTLQYVGRYSLSDAWDYRVVYFAGFLLNRKKYAVLPF